MLDTWFTVFRHSVKLNGYKLAAYFQGSCLCVRRKFICRREYFHVDCLNTIEFFTIRISVRLSDRSEVKVKVWISSSQEVSNWCTQGWTLEIYYLWLRQTPKTGVSAVWGWFFKLDVLFIQFNLILPPTTICLKKSNINRNRDYFCTFTNRFIPECPCWVLIVNIWESCLL